MTKVHKCDICCVEHAQNHKNTGKITKIRTLYQWAFLPNARHIGRATRFVDSGFPTLLILGPTLLILGPPLSILGPTLLILEPILLILVVKMGVAILKKTDTIQTVDSGFE